MEELLKIKKRKDRSEKDKFLSEIESKLNSYGYDSQQEVFGQLINKVNLSTKCENPDYIFIAHYDTGNIMPFWINWLFRLIGINRQLLLFAIVISWSKFFMPWLESMQEVIATTLSFVFGISFLSVLFPNPKNYDDNTSGVITLLSIAKYAKLKKLNNIQFLFVDKEESGLLGSLSQYRKMRKNGNFKNHPTVISIDCVGGIGKTPLIIRNGKSDYENKYKDLLRKEFGECKSIRMILPASDNFSFRKLGAINISFVSKSIIPGGYFINGIHSLKDKYINRDRIEHLAKSLVDKIEITEANKT